MGKVLFLGVAGSGKSALTASLVRCLEGDADSEWSLRPENKEAFLFFFAGRAGSCRRNFPCSDNRSEEHEMVACLSG